ncbi:uncharacterized protein N0V89_003384 [Didymosphaeria variabile]|uniref:Uncharacterized protein n=1 Tax=Didymosphaeria variabile TaxID=1932322 RepID=A0A9W8XQ52_9PLEO|nr:uncharacterized protein N0V89_003384 [Didymosphaeria variabile]KAJ4355368.1 hypothetical protein N0V89_003384 [Didymosphaeria variabile]
MAARQLPGQPPTGAVPPAVMEEYLKLTKKQQERRDSFELRAADVRRNFQEIDAHEQQQFWMSYSQVNQVNQVNQVRSGPNRRPVPLHQAGANMPSRPHPPNQRRPAAQQKATPAPVRPKLPANAPKRAPTAPRAITGQGAAHIQGKPATKAQPRPVPKPHYNGPKQQKPEVIDLCSDEDIEPQPRSMIQNNTAGPSCRQVAFIPPLPSGALSFFGNNDKIFRPGIKDEEDRNSQPIHTSSGAPGPVNVPNGLSAPIQFKVPQVPSGAASTSERMRREGTVTSQALCQTMPPNPIVGADNTRHDRFSLPTPPQSQVPPTRKRKVQPNVSDDSDNISEWEPSSGDDVPLIQRQQKPALKKAKPTHCSGIARPPSGVPKMGFKPMKPLMRNRAQPNSKPAISSAPAISYTPAASTSSRIVERALRSESPSVRAAVRSSARRAKQKASAALDKHFQRELEFHNEEDIREADEREHRLKSTFPTSTEPELRLRLGRMSITSAPSVRPSIGPVNTSDVKDAVDDAIQSRDRGSAYGLSQWTQDRLRGDRYLIQSQASSSQGRGDEESESELDVSAFQYVNGRIVDRVEEMDMTEDT